MECTGFLYRSAYLRLQKKFPNSDLLLKIKNYIYSRSQYDTNMNIYIKKHEWNMVGNHGGIFEDFNELEIRGV